jgi:hypothetical protein
MSLLGESVGVGAVVGVEESNKSAKQQRNINSQATDTQSSVSVSVSVAYPTDLHNHIDGNGKGRQQQTTNKKHIDSNGRDSNNNDNDGATSGVVITRSDAAIQWRRSSNMTNDTMTSLSTTSSRGRRGGGSGSGSSNKEDHLNGERRRRMNGLSRRGLPKEKSIKNDSKRSTTSTSITTSSGSSNKGKRMAWTNVDNIPVRNAWAPSTSSNSTPLMSAPLADAATIPHNDHIAILKRPNSALPVSLSSSSSLQQHSTTTTLSSSLVSASRSTEQWPSLSLSKVTSSTSSNATIKLDSDDVNSHNNYSNKGIRLSSRHSTLSSWQWRDDATSVHSNIHRQLMIDKQLQQLTASTTTPPITSLKSKGRVSSSSISTIERPVMRSSSAKNSQHGVMMAIKGNKKGSTPSTVSSTMKVSVTSKTSVESKNRNKPRPQLGHGILLNPSPAPSVDIMMLRIK